MERYQKDISNQNQILNIRRRSYNMADIKELFGKDIADLVDGVTWW